MRMDIPIFNMTDKESSAQAICTSFSDLGVLKNSAVQNVTIGAQSSLQLPYSEATKTQRLFVWNIPTMTPLATARQIH